MKTSRLSIFLLITLATTVSVSQIPETPHRPAHVSEKDYQLGVALLKSANSQVKNDNFNFTSEDYWNYASAFLQMGQPQEAVLNFLTDSKKVDRVKFCQIAVRYHDVKSGIENTKFFKYLGDDYTTLLSDCVNL
ncbi:MAG: hypothetical protein JSU09_02440 [Bacteroidetes bacterium]|jgi:hypothetical protein|nr:hypothetical protein [Bacteroidota bacterium]